MPTVIDSKVEPLPAPTIISMMVGELDLKGVPPKAALVAIAQEINMPDVDLVQVGNTVFVGHRGKGEKKNMMWGRAFNVDTAQNFIANGLKYFTHLQNLGITKYITEYDGDVYDSAFKTWKRYVDKGDSKLAVGLYSNGKSRAYVSLGKIPLSEVM
jgi:hypothetical protein